MNRRVLGKEWKKMSNGRFNITIRAEIETDDGQPFADETLRYHGMSYSSMVVIEQVWGKFHQDLIGLGEAKAGKK